MLSEQLPVADENSLFIDRSFTGRRLRCKAYSSASSACCPQTANRKAFKRECCRSPDPIRTRNTPRNRTASSPTSLHSIALRGTCGLTATPGEASCSVHPSISSGHSSSSSEPLPPPPAGAGGGGRGTTLHHFTGGRYAAALAARYGPSLDVYGPVWGWLQPVKSQEAFEPLSPVQ